MQKKDTKSKEGSLRHYFISKEHSDDEYFNFAMQFKDKNYIFKSCNDVFSKNQVDYGSLVLVNTILKKDIIKVGDTLDMCCGYGPIGMFIADNTQCNVFMCDINTTAVLLARENVKVNKCARVKDIFESNMFANVTRNFEHIVSNPPIKTGKKILLEFVDGAYSHLQDGGDLTLVIKKNLGADSLKKYINELFGNCNVLQRDKGYYILYATK